MQRSEADYNLTAQAFGEQAETGCFVQFRLHPKQDPIKSAAAGRPIFTDTEYIRIMAPGNKESVMDRPVREQDKQRFSKQYFAWKNGEEEKIEGTPLEAWPPLTKSQVEELKFFHIRTVEQLAQVSDADAQKFMGIGKFRQKARTFVLQANAGAAESKLAEEIEKKDNEIAALQAAIDDLKALVAQQAAQSAPVPPKPRGRPKAT